MTIPKWLFPIVAIVAAAAVGVAAVLIGMRFAPTPPASAFVPPPTETAEVLAPLPVDDGDDGDDGDGATEDLDPPLVADGEGEPPVDAGDEAPADDPDASASVGETEVAVEEEDPAATDGDLLHLIDLIGLSPDLLAGLLRAGIGERDDDPCAPSDDTPPADGCPPGAPGTVLFTDPLPPFWMNAEAWPRTHAELGGVPDRDLGTLLCDPAETGEGEASLRIRATAPGNWTVAYWPTERPENRLAAEASSDETQIADWMVEADDIEHGYYLAEHCLVLTGIEPGTAYTAVVSGGDVFGRDVAPNTVHFHSDGVAQHPSLQLQTVGQNLLLASAAHSPDERVETRAYLIEADTVLDCSAPETDALATLTHVDGVIIDEAEQWRQNITDDNTRKVVDSYRVPEGSRLQVCARWFPGDAAPEWESAQATYQSWAIVEPADRLVPILTLVGFEPRDERIVDVEFTTSTPEGLRCESLRWSSDQPIDRVLCGSRELEGGTAGTDGDRLFDRGFTGDLVVRTSAVLSSGETSESTVVLPAGEGACVGVCTAPDASTFGISTIGGTALVEQSWIVGRVNGRTSWYVSTVDSHAVDYVRPDTPQIDRSADWAYTEPGFSPFVSGYIRIPVDRPVDWSLEAPGAEPTDGTELPCAAAEPLSSTGASVDGIIDIRLGRLCLGATYTPVLTLTDEDGNISSWSVYPGAAGNWWGSAGLITPPRLDVVVRYRVDAWDIPYSYLFDYRLIVGASHRLTNDYADPVGTRCVRSDGIVKSEGTLETTFGPVVTVGLFYVSGDQRYAGPDGCAGESYDSTPEPEVVQVPIQDLRNPDGVLLETESGKRVRVWASLP